jgi:hypothetical protein
MYKNKSLFFFVDVARCLRVLGVKPVKSLDSLGRERFHPLDIKTHYQGTYPKWLYKYASNPIQKVCFFKNSFCLLHKVQLLHFRKMTKGLGCCSDTSISFHYMRSEVMYNVSTFLRELEANQTSRDGKISSEFKFEDLIKYLAY